MLTGQLIDRSQLVLTATREHRAAVVSLVPRASRYAFTLNEFARLVASLEPSELEQIADAAGLVPAAAAQRGFAPPPAHPDDADIADPYRQPMKAFERAGAEIDRAVTTIVAGLRAVGAGRAGMSPRTPSQRRLEAPSRRRWIIVAVIGFLALDVLLVGIAFSMNQAGPQQEPGPIPTFGTSPSRRAPARHRAPRRHRVQLAEVAAIAPAPRFLAAVSATEAWRASPGACPGTSTVIERSTDKGATWKTLDTGNDAVHQIVSLINANRTRASVIGPAGADCKVGFFTSFTQGQDWATYPDNLAGATYLDPSDPAKLHVAGEVEAAPARRRCSCGTTTPRRR